jgi:chorismate mutase
MAVAAEEKSLGDLRREVDAIDDALQDLLMRRAHLADAIARMKPRTAGRIPLSLAMRPAREAEIMRRIVARHQGAPPLGTVIRVVREVLAASLRAQVTFRLQVPLRAPQLAELARAYFGGTAELVYVENTARLINACGDDPDSIGILPAGESADAWWARLARPGAPGPRAIANHPFLIQDAAAPTAYAVAAIEHEATGDDTTLLLAEVTPSASRARMATLLNEAGIAGRVVAGNPGVAASPVLIEAEGFIARDDPRLARFAAEGAFAGSSIVSVGGFANPVIVKEGGVS